MNRRAIGFAATSAITFATAPLVRRAMLRIGTLDIPNHRSSHVVPIPRGGGIAALMGVAGGLIAERGGLETRIVSAVAALAAIGYGDDHTSASGGLSAVTRLGAQAVAGVFLAESSMLSHVAALVVVPSAVNVVNFMDGINGITSLTAIVWGLNAQFSASEEVALIGSLASGAAVGFLPWNVPDAKLFLGDVGSYMFGGLFAAGIMRSTTDRRALLDAVKTGSPLLPYAADAAQAIVRRRRAGASITEAHREHVYQRLVDSGRLSHLHMSIVHAAVAAACAVSWQALPTTHAVIATAGIVGSYLYLPTAVERLGS